MIIRWSDHCTYQECKGNVAEHLAYWFDYGFDGKNRTKPLEIKLSVEEAEQLKLECRGKMPERIDGIPIRVIESKPKKLREGHVQEGRGKARRGPLSCS